jgi:hypothetical protein
MRVFDDGGKIRCDGTGGSIDLLIGQQLPELIATAVSSDHSDDGDVGG